ncbi:MAG: pyrroline-5-carboxylate reductase [Deltaproteobacteria bacterium]|nr:pyrroline-5-carboxylate reductase [Deltaproteobacteria bacterium]
MLKDKIGIIGAGKIGSALLRGIIGAGLVGKEHVVASDAEGEVRKRLGAEIGIKLTADNVELCEFADIVILAVKPQVVEAVLQPLGKSLGKKKLLVSVAAGVPTERLQNLLGLGARVIRVMTNTPLVVGAAASAYAKGSHATQEDLDKVGEILSSVGIALPLDERYLDAVTGLSGSGPAYVFLFIESLTDGGVQMGLSRDAALRLALQTVYGAAKMALESGKHLGELKDEVTSPGGTTIAGLFALERGGFKGTIMEAIRQATKRSEALGKGES